jgi:hypothetical protein
MGSGFKAATAVWRARRTIRTQHAAWRPRDASYHKAAPGTFSKCAPAHGLPEKPDTLSAAPSLGDMCRGLGATTLCCRAVHEVVVILLWACILLQRSCNNHTSQTAHPWRPRTSSPHPHCHAGEERSTLLRHVSRQGPARPPGTACHVGTAPPRQGRPQTDGRPGAGRPAASRPPRPTSRRRPTAARTPRPQSRAAAPRPAAAATATCPPCRSPSRRGRRRARRGSTRPSRPRRARRRRRTRPRPRRRGCSAPGRRWRPRRSRRSEGVRQGRGDAGMSA